MATTVIKIEGMHCQHCVAAVREALSDLDGVDKVEVDLEGGSADVVYDSAAVDVKSMEEAIADEGFIVVR